MKGARMSTLYIADCSKMPSEINCDLKISGTDKAVVVDAAYQHALSSIHKHSPNEEGLKEKIANNLETQEAL
jgi:predicted small metal-binding protein